MEHVRYRMHYASPIGMLTLASDGEHITGLWNQGQAHFPVGMEDVPLDAKRPVFQQASRWLDCYFAGQDPKNPPPLKPKGSPFQQEVWAELLKIPPGSTISYGQIAKNLNDRGRQKPSSARAVGLAVGRNPISILIPCHRVVGASGSLRGYAAGLARKEHLLRLEAVPFIGLAKVRV